MPYHENTYPCTRRHLCGTGGWFIAVLLENCDEGWRLMKRLGNSLAAIGQHLFRAFTFMNYYKQA